MPTLDLIADLEYIISRFAANPIKKVMRAHLTYQITRYVKSSKKQNRITQFLVKAAKTTARFLKEHCDIFVSSSDKGNVTIIAKRSDFDHKLETLFNNPELFEILPSDPTTSLQAKNNRLISTLFNKTKHFITEQQSKNLKTYIAISPRAFGQYKFHKENLPVRPIISTINSPCYKLSKFLTNVLKQSFRSKFTVKNSKQVVKTLIKTRILPEYILVSFDVCNCFNNVSTQLALKIVEKYFDIRIKPNTKIPKSTFMNLLKFCLIECNYF